MLKSLFLKTAFLCWMAAPVFSVESSGESSDTSVSVSSKKLEKSIQKDLPQWRMECPEMRTFSVMSTANFHTVTPTFCEHGGYIDRHKQIKDALRSGKQLGDLAKELGNTCTTLTSSSMGRSIDFSPISSWKDHWSEAVKKSILQLVFSEKEGKEGVHTLSYAMGGMIWIQVQKIEPKRFLNPKELEAAEKYFLKMSPKEPENPAEEISPKEPENRDELQNRNEQVALKVPAFKKNMGRKRLRKKLKNNIGRKRLHKKLKKNLGRKKAPASRMPHQI